MYVLFLYLKISLSSILNGLNKTTFTCTANISGLIIRIIFLIILVPHIGIHGYIYGLIISNIFVCILNYIKLMFIYRFKINIINNIICPVSISIISIFLVTMLEKTAFMILPCFLSNINYSLILFVKLSLSCIIYLIILFLISNSPISDSKASDSNQL